MSNKTETATTTKKAKAFNIRDIADGRSDVFRLDPRKIHVEEGFNVRRDYGDIKELKESIRAMGVINPLQVYIKNGEVFLGDGHRRFKAISMLLEEGVDIKNVPVINMGKVSEEERTARLIAYNDGKPLTTYEQALVVDRLIKFGWKDKEIAEKIGRTQGHISNLKLLLSAPKEVIKDIEEERISSTYAMEMIRSCGDDHAKLKAKLKEGREKAAELGQKKVTKKVAERGTNAKVSSKERKAGEVDFYRRCIEAIRENDSALKEEVIEQLEERIGILVG